MPIPTLSWDANSLLRDGAAWMPVMGEIHFARVSEHAWARELLKMKAGGISLISTYAFWIHHEEAEGHLDFSGRRSLRAFVQAVAAAGLPLICRIGPWCHGEVRNGGLPDWVIERCGKRARTNDPAYLGLAKAWYGQVAGQLDGLLWKQGGPVVGIQIDNEYHGPAEHLLMLKSMARDAGIDVPIYTKTGWPKTSTPVPTGELLPLYGAYAEGFWDRALTPMPGHFRRGFHFSPARMTDDIGSDRLARQRNDAPAESQTYPFLTCELGGGMEMSYHRRVRIDPRDTLALLITRLGSGSNLPGYYMYHGGTNPPSPSGLPLQESQATGYANDVPQKAYDFQAPLGQYGQIREPFHLLRRVHQFIRDFGPALAVAKSWFPAEGPVRWCLRRGPVGSFLFVNNHERLAELPPIPAAEFPGTPFPPMDIPASASFFLPFDLRIGDHQLLWATAQPICRIGSTWIFSEVPGIPPRLAFANQPILEVTPSRAAVATFEDATIHVLSEADALAAYAVHDGIAIVGGGTLLDDRGKFSIEGDGTSAITLHALSAAAPASQTWDPPPKLPPVAIQAIQPAGPLRVIPIHPRGVAEAPTDADFAAAAVWRIAIPNGLPAHTLLRTRYQGDVARYTANGILLTDHFSNNGAAFDLALAELPPDARTVDLQILPLRRDAPIYYSAPPTFAEGQATLLELNSVEWVSRRTVTLSNVP